MDEREQGEPIGPECHHGNVGGCASCRREELTALRAELDDAKGKLCGVVDWCKRGGFDTPTNMNRVAHIVLGLVSSTGPCRHEIREDVLSGKSCKEEQDMGNGPCGVCVVCLREEVKRLRGAISVASDDLYNMARVCGNMDMEQDLIAVKNKMERRAFGEGKEEG